MPFSRVLQKRNWLIYSSIKNKEFKFLNHKDKVTFKNIEQVASAASGGEVTIIQVAGACLPLLWRQCENRAGRQSESRRAEKQ